MTRHRTDRPDGTESATLVAGGAVAVRSAVPVQNTNIIQIIAEHLPAEYSALQSRIAKHQADMEAALSYKAQLERIAADAGVDLTPTTPTEKADGQ